MVIYYVICILYIYFKQLLYFISVTNGIGLMYYKKYSIFVNSIFVYRIIATYISVEKRCFVEFLRNISAKFDAIGMLDKWIDRRHHPNRRAPRRQQVIRPPVQLVCGRVTMYARITQYVELF